MAWTILAGRIQPVCLMDEDGNFIDGTNPLDVAGSITIPGAVTVNDGGGSLTVDGTVTADAGTGPWPVTDNGGSLTVDGTVTANVGTGPWPVTDNGGSLTVDDGAGALTVDGTVASNIYGYRSSDTSWQPLRLDKATNTIQIIDYSHHEIHAGSHFFVTDYQTIASGSSVDWLITTPNTTAWPHLTFEVQGTAITTAILYEGADRTGSVALTEQNNDRNSATAATTTVDRGTAGGTTDGTAIWQSSGGSATGGFRGGADNRQETEIILKQNTKYILRVTSGTNGNICAVKLRWYEHTNIA